MKHRPGKAATPPSGGPRFWRGTLFILALIAGISLAYLPVWHAGFVWDDDLHLLNNPVLQAGGLARVWVPGGYLNYWPLTFTTYWLESRAWGLNPLGYHLVNIALHILAAVLVWRILLRVGLTEAGAMLAAAVFAVHPVAVEAVAWITQTKTLLPAVLALLSALCYLRYEQRGGWWDYGLALVLFVLSGLARGVALTLPAVLLMYIWWRRERITGRDLAGALPYILIGVAMAVVEVIMQRHVAGHEVVRGDPAGIRALTAGWAVWFYLGKLIWPLDLNFVYPRWNINPARLMAYLPGLVLLALLTVAWTARRSWGRAVLMVVVCYLALLLPVLGLVNIYFMKFSFVADHYQYLAMVVPIAAGAAILTRGVASVKGNTRFWHAGLSAAGVVVLLAALTFAQAGVYRDPPTLWRDVLAKNPGCWLAYNNLGVVLAGGGQVEEAIVQFQLALKTKPDDAETHYNLGNALLGCGRVDEAITHYQAALVVRNDYAQAHANLGVALARHGRVDEAMAHDRRALVIKPDYAEAYNTLGIALGRKGRLAEAIAQFQKALAIKPDYADARRNLQGAGAQ